MKKSIGNNDITIYDSYTVNKKLMNFVLDEIRAEVKKKGQSNAVLDNRSNASLKREWVTHNFLYSIGMFRSHTKDVNLNYPQKWYIRWGYNIAGVLFWIFTK